MALPMIFRATGGFSSKYVPSASLTAASTMPLTSLFPSFALVWPSNCGLRHLDADHAGQPFTDVVAGQRLDFLFQEVVGAA